MADKGSSPLSDEDVVDAAPLAVDYSFAHTTHGTTGSPGDDTFEDTHEDINDIIDEFIIDDPADATTADHPPTTADPTAGDQTHTEPSSTEGVPTTTNLSVGSDSAIPPSDEVPAPPPSGPTQPGPSSPLSPSAVATGEGLLMLDPEIPRPAHSGTAQQVPFSSSPDPVVRTSPEQPSHPEDDDTPLDEILRQVRAKGKRKVVPESSKPPPKKKQKPTKKTK